MAEPLSPEVLGAAIGTLTVSITTLLSHLKGKSRKKETEDSLHRHFRKLGSDIGEQMKEVRGDIAGLRTDVAEVRAFCVGPDGQNGFRGDIREIREDIKDTRSHLRELEKAQRDAAAARVGTLDRRMG